MEADLMDWQHINWDDDAQVRAWIIQGIGFTDLMAMIRQDEEAAVNGIQRLLELIIEGKITTPRLESPEQELPPSRSPYLTEDHAERMEAYRTEQYREDVQELADRIDRIQDQDQKINLEIGNVREKGFTVRWNNPDRYELVINKGVKFYTQRYGSSAEANVVDCIPGATYMVQISDISVPGPNVVQSYPVTCLG